MGKIVYSYYTDADAEAVAALFTRNQFYMGKYEPEMTGARFTENQQKKGMIFGIVGKDGDKVANYLACYTVGGQRVCAPGELLVGIILVDKKYRAAVFSIAEMFNLLLEKAVELGYRVLLTEIGKTNLASLLLNRKTGALLLDAEPTIHGELVLYNYMPALIRHVCTDDILETDVMPSLLSHVGKKDLLTPTPVDAQGCLEMHGKANGYDYVFTVERATALVVGSFIENVFYARQELRDRHVLRYCAYCEKAATAKLTFVGRDGTEKKLEKTCPLGKMQTFTAPSDCAHILLEDPDHQCIYRYDVQVQPPKRPKSRAVAPFTMQENSGYLYCGAGLFELWPCFTYPYLEGAIVPNENKALSFTFVNKRLFTATAEVNGVRIERRYDLRQDGRAAISTKIDNPEGKMLDPLFHFGFTETQRSCTVYLTDGTVMTKKRDNTEYMFPELPYHDYQKQPYSEKTFDRIEVTSDDGTFVITTDVPSRCFFHRNYLRLLPETDATDFGTVFIEKQSR